MIRGPERRVLFGPLRNAEDSLNHKKGHHPVPSFFVENLFSYKPYSLTSQHMAAMLKAPSSSSRLFTASKTSLRAW